MGRRIAPPAPNASIAGPESIRPRPRDVRCLSTAEHNCAQRSTTDSPKFASKLRAKFLLWQVCAEMPPPVDCRLTSFGRRFLPHQPQVSRRDRRGPVVTHWPATARAIAPDARSTARVISSRVAPSASGIAQLRLGQILAPHRHRARNVRADNVSTIDDALDQIAIEEITVSMGISV